MARIDPEFKERIDSRAEALRKELQNGQEMPHWLFIEYILDSFHAASASWGEKEVIAKARRLYHLRVPKLLAESNPESLPVALWAALLKAFEEAMRHA